MQFLSLLKLLTVVAALPNGAPVCSVEAVPGLLGASQNLGFSTRTRANVDGSISVTISNSQNIPSFLGILMYVTSSANPNQHLGSFILPNNKFRFIGSGVCGNNGIAGSSITHSSPSGIATGSTLTWLPAAADVKRPNVVVKCVIVLSVNGQHTYQALPDTLVNFTPPQAPKAVPPSAKTVTASKPSKGTHSATKTITHTTHKPTTTTTKRRTTTTTTTPYNRRCLFTLCSLQMHLINLLINSVLSFPVNETCSVDILTSNVNTPQSSLEYGLSQVTYNDGSVQLTLNNYAGLTSFTNILLYVTALTNSSQHLGFFPSIDWTRFHYVQYSICQSQGISGQGSATITDSNTGSIQLPYSFMFNATKEEIASQNNMLVRVVVFSGGRWQRLDPFAIKPSILGALTLSNSTGTQAIYASVSSGNSESPAVTAAAAQGPVFSSAFEKSTVFSVLSALLLALF
ncbi:hypothetical protein HK103_006505 [Boothiomyces macroporosus]|uniref:Reelin domain-containing protein n=1 Tax=Boothiomyces macroporosus TaxID=261099 RepID=A0AAD5Y6D1_9FUNG|nr:hypothetical protein HK103_006505 [Boothiomyces macroporosus]